PCSRNPLPKDEQKPKGKPLLPSSPRLLRGSLSEHLASGVDAAVVAGVAANSRSTRHHPRSPLPSQWRAMRLSRFYFRENPFPSIAAASTPRPNPRHSNIKLPVLRKRSAASSLQRAACLPPFLKGRGLQSFPESRYRSTAIAENRRPRLQYFDNDSPGRTANPSPSEMGEDK